jgi:heterodisulfide reductase subunit C
MDRRRLPHPLLRRRVQAKVNRGPRNWKIGHLEKPWKCVSCFQNLENGSGRKTLEI